MRARPAPTVAIAAAIIVVGCTACSSARRAAGPTTSRPSASSAPISATPSNAAPPRPSACRIGSLSITDSGADLHHDGRAFGTIVTRNTGTTTCTITGYPGMALVGAPIRLRRAPGSTPHQVTLRPGGTASFGFSHRDYARGAHCDLVTGARVYDPDGSGYSTTSTSFDECEGIRATGLIAVPVVVGPFVAGSRASLA